VLYSNFISMTYVNGDDDKLMQGGDPRRGFSPHAGTGMGKKASLLALAGTRTGNLSPRRDGDGEAFPDGEFSVAIFTLKTAYNPSGR